VEAVNLAVNLVQFFGASPFFCDPLEFQGWHALTTDLPQTASAALLNLSLSQPGWRDAGQVAGSSFAAAARVLDEADPTSWLENRQNLARVLDLYIASLQEMRRGLLNNDSDQLESSLISARKVRPSWEKQRRTPPGVNTNQQRTPSSGETLGSLIGLSQLSGLFKPKQQS
jgi:prephenate dehydrogenase